MSMKHRPVDPSHDVASILDKYQKGSHKEYDIFVSQLSDPDITSDLLVSYLRSVRECITVLDKEFEVLVGVFLRIDWPCHSLAAVREYQSFLLNLLSAHTFYLRAALRMLVKLFLPKSAFDQSKEKVAPSIDEAATAFQTQTFTHVHTVLRAVTQIVPLTPTVLMNHMRDLFPFMTKDAYCQECYVKNLLQVTCYVPSVRQRVLELIVDKMMKLDVRSSREIIKESEGSDDEDMDIFDLDSANVDSEGRDQESLAPMVHQDAEKLDLMLHVMFRYIQNVCYPNGDQDWEITKQLYRELLLVFERIILSTHASCHVQFIMFYICSFKQPICEGFLDYLWKKVQDPNVQGIFRQAAVYYVASLLSRAEFVSTTTLMACLGLMCGWIHRYIQQPSQDATQSDILHHGSYYAVCQAVFYVFAFRNKDIYDMKKGPKWAEGLKFQTIVTSRLNPLKVCLPAVVKAFASATRLHQLVFCDTVIERNNRSMLPVAACGAGIATLLDSFFPFDPYLLHRSAAFIQPLYREYQGSLPVVLDRMDSNEDDDFLPDQVPELGSDNCTVEMSLGKSPTDFTIYGTSPGFKHL